MKSDVGTIFWKEWREIYSGGGRRSKLSLVVFAAVFGVLLPLQNGRSWVESPVYLLFWVWMPLFMVSSIVADSIAGERERRTLETLLASRLPDSAILLGKASAAISYGAGLSWALLLVGLVTVNVVFGKGELVMYPPLALAGIVVFTLLGAGLSTGAGIHVSLRAATVRQAQQTMSIAMLVLLGLPTIGLQFLPAASTGQIERLVTGINPVMAVATAGVVLLAVDALLLVTALARFKRARLILD